MLIVSILSHSIILIAKQLYECVYQIIGAKKKVATAPTVLLSMQRMNSKKRKLKLLRWLLAICLKAFGSMCALPNWHSLSEPYLQFWLLFTSHSFWPNTSNRIERHTLQSRERKTIIMLKWCRCVRRFFSLSRKSHSDSIFFFIFFNDDFFVNFSIIFCKCTWSREEEKMNLKILMHCHFVL